MIGIKIGIIVLFVVMNLFDFIVEFLDYKARKNPIPENLKDIYSEEEYKKWLDYSAAKYKLKTVRNIFGFIVSFCLLTFGGYYLINNLLVDLNITNGLLNTLLFFVGIKAITFIPDIVFDAIETFKIEEKYGFNKTTKNTFVRDQIIGLLMLVVLFGGMIIGLQFIYEQLGIYFIIAAWVFVMVILLVFQLLYTKIFIKLSNKLTPLEEGELKDKINELATKCNYEVSKISIMDGSKRSTKINAFFVGMGKMKQIVLYDTLVEKLNDDQILTVLAHEIGHNKHKHTTKNLIQTAITLSVFFGIMYLLLQYPIISQSFGFESTHFGLSLILFFIALSPVSILLNLIKSPLSRKYEYQADKYAVEHTSKEAMITALKVLAISNYAQLTPHPLKVKLFYSHPPLKDRIEAIEKL